jgi:hypothetical protein
MKKEYQNEGLADLESEFEFEMDTESGDQYESIENEFEADDEFEDMQNEYETDNEFEADDEYNDSEHESDNEFESWNDEYGLKDNEYEDRIYAALNGEHESSFEMEREIDSVLHEMEIDYFFNPFKKLKQYKNKILNAAKGFLPAGTLQTLAKLAGGDLRSLLKSDLFKKGLSFAANAVAPGIGGTIASGLLNSEMPGAGDARSQAKQAVQVAKTAFKNMAGLMPSLQPGNIPKQIQSFSRQALSSALKKHAMYKGKRRRTIMLRQGSIVVVKPGKVHIYY